MQYKHRRNQFLLVHFWARLRQTDRSKTNFIVLNVTSDNYAVVDLLTAKTTANVTMRTLHLCLFQSDDYARSLRLILHERSKRGSWDAAQNAWQRQPNFQMRKYINNNSSFKHATWSKDSILCFWRDTIFCAICSTLKAARTCCAVNVLTSRISFLFS